MDFPKKMQKRAKSGSTDSETKCHFQLRSITGRVLSSLSFTLHIRQAVCVTVSSPCPAAPDACHGFFRRSRSARGRQDPGALRGGDLPLPHHLHGLSHENKEAAPGRGLRLHQAAPQPDLTQLRFHGPVATIRVRDLVFHPQPPRRFMQKRSCIFLCRGTDFRQKL